MIRYPLSVSILVALVTLAARAEAFDESGTVDLPQPQSIATAGLSATALLAPCSPASALQGLDGYWIDLPASVVGCNATLANGEAFTDADGAFYNAACRLIDVSALAGHTSVESGTVPAGSRWLFVYLYALSRPAGSFLFTAEDCAAH